MLYNVIKIHAPAVAQQENSVEISTLSTIPEFLRDAISVEHHQLILDNVSGPVAVPLGSVICFEKSDKTTSGFNCWSIGQVGVNLTKVDGLFYTKPRILHAMLIPSEDEAKPLWVKHCNLTYNGDGTATININGKPSSGRIGIDFILSHGMDKNGNPKATILSTFDKDYHSYLVCDDSGKDIGLLSDIYPAWSSTFSEFLT